MRRPGFGSEARVKGRGRISFKDLFFFPPPFTLHCSVWLKRCAEPDGGGARRWTVDKIGEVESWACMTDGAGGVCSLIYVDPVVPGQR